MKYAIWLMIRAIEIILKSIFNFSTLGSPQNVRQRTPIAKNFSSQEETFGDRTLQNSAFEEISRRQIPQGVQPSPERSLLSPTQESNYSDNIGNRSNDRANLPTTFRNQMNKSPPRNIFDDL